MKKTLSVIIAFILIITIILLTVINQIIVKYGKGQVELHASKAVKGEVSIGSMYFNYYPTAISFMDVQIKPYDESDALKGVKIKRVDIGVDTASMYKELLVVQYVKIMEPEVEFDAGELGIKDLGKKAVKEVAVGLAGQALLGPIGIGLGIAKKGVDAVKDSKEKKEQEKQKQEMEKEYLENAKKQRQFLIANLFINGGKFIPHGDVLWLGKGEHVELPDMKFKNIDNTSGLEMAKKIQKAVEDAVKERLNLKASDKEKKEEKQ